MKNNPAKGVDVGTLAAIQYLPIGLVECLICDPFLEKRKVYNHGTVWTT